MATIKLSNKPQVQTMADGDTVVTVLANGNVRRISKPDLISALEIPFVVDDTDDAEDIGEAVEAVWTAGRPCFLQTAPGYSAGDSGGSGDGDSMAGSVGAVTAASAGYLLPLISRENNGSSGYTAYIFQGITGDRTVKKTLLKSPAGAYAWGTLTETELGGGLPDVTAADNGKIAKVVSGAWAAVSEPDVSQIGM